MNLLRLSLVAFVAAVCLPFTGCIGDDIEWSGFESGYRGVMPAGCPVDCLPRR